MEITGKSRIIFVLADPVDHVRASAVLNEYFRSLNFDVAASRLHVAPGDLAQVVDAIRRMRNVAGFGVTIPHKVAVLPHLESITPRARLIGAVNFVKREADGRLYGDNLDAPGFMAGLERNNIPVQGRKVLDRGGSPSRPSRLTAGPRRAPPRSDHCPTTDLQDGSYQRPERDALRHRSCSA